MRHVTSVWLVTLALLLRVVALLVMPATIAVARGSTALVAPPPTITMHLAYACDNAGRRTGLALPDGKSQSWGYDAAGRVNGLTQPGSSPNSYTVSHNGAGDLTALSAPNGGDESWRYDDAGQITGTS